MADEVSREEAKRAFFGDVGAPIRGTPEYLSHLEKRIAFLEDLVFDLYQRS